MSLFADVVFPLPLARAFTYAVPEELCGRLRPGQRVRAPLGTRPAVGFVVRIHDQAPPAAAKPVLEAVDPDPIIPPDILDLTERLGRRFLSSQGEMLRTAVPPSLKRRRTLRYRLSEAGREALAAGRMTPAESRLAEVLLLSAPKRVDYSLAFLKRKAGVSDIAAVASRLVTKGWAAETAVESSVKPSSRPEREAPSLQLDLDFRVDEATAAAIRIMTADLSHPGFAPFLLTGPADRRAAAILALSGEVLSRGRSVLALFPEIGMSRSAEEAFADRLGERVVLLHGRMTERAREDARRRIENEAPLVVAGPRSAVFMPLRGLGLIALDEEADESYRQLESPAYDARTAAWMRAEASGARLVLASEAPRVETYERARRGGWLIEIQGPPPPRAEVVDDRGFRGLLAAAVAQRITTAVESGRRVLVFTRRKGYASFLFCPRCGHIPSCRLCGTALGLGGRPRRLACRACGTEAEMLSACPSCGARVVEPRGPGVEAIEEELRRILPGTGVAGLDPDRVRTRSARDAALARFAAGRTTVLVGSPFLAHQSGLAPASLVVLVNPESTLGLADFRSSSRLYGEIRRPLRFLDGADPEARGLIQTSWPDHFALRAAAAGDYQAFFEEEIFRRRSLGDPPFSALAEIVLSASEARALGRAARGVADSLRAADRRLEVLGPSEAFHPASGAVRSAQIVVRAERPEILDEAVADALRDVRVKKQVFRAD